MSCSLASPPACATSVYGATSNVTKHVPPTVSVTGTRVEDEAAGGGAGLLVLSCCRPSSADLAAALLTDAAACDKTDAHELTLNAVLSGRRGPVSEHKKDQAK